MLHKYKFECIIDESERLPSNGSCMTNGRVGVIIIIIVDIDRERNTRFRTEKKKYHRRESRRLFNLCENSNYMGT